MASGGSYEVFLNFRGVDTRTNFTSHLRNSLKSKGVDVYMDAEELHTVRELGPALLKAIEQAKISIPVFSKSYATSRWCLEELNKILERHERSNQIVLPIYLDVKPSEVQNQTGSFADAFRPYEDSEPDEIVDQWRKSLTKAGKLKGWILAEVENGDESKLIRLVVGKVLRELNTLMVAKHPIGLDSHVKHMISLLCLESKEPQFVGICGMGGIGKTTMAKALYKEIRNRFEGYSFLADVREQASDPMGLIRLQIQLLDDTLRKQIYQISDADRGAKMIEEMLQETKVLIILDDVDEHEQLNALAGDLNWFGPGSRIIVTTRDKRLRLGQVDENNIYCPEGLDNNQSLRLFSKHAFRRDQPRDDYRFLSGEMVKYADGLPLALEIWGSFLYHVKGKEKWEAALQQLKEVPHNDILKKLKISYDGLNSNEKTIFLDIACFFIGMEQEIPNYFWEGCDFYPDRGLDVLIQKCLVRIDKDNKLRMHDQLRDMGRHIVFEEGPQEPGERSRLWSRKEIIAVLKEHKGTPKVEAILPNEPEIGEGFRIEDFAMMYNLRLLHINGVDLEGNIEHLPSSLRWLCWQRCPFKIIPSNFCPEKLVVLDLSRSINIRELQSERFGNLKVLDFSYCSNLALSPNFSGFPQLKILILKECEALIDIESIRQLKCLIHLDLTRCIKLNVKLSTICAIPSLQRLISCNGRKWERKTL